MTDSTDRTWKDRPMTDSTDRTARETPLVSFNRPEDDTPVRKNRGLTDGETVASPTKPHRTPTAQLPQADAPQPGPQPPTEFVAAPKRTDELTAMMTAADLPKPRPDAEGSFDRVAWAADKIGDTAEALSVDRKPVCAEVLRGCSIALKGGSTRTPLEFVTARLLTRALVADGGIRFEEQDLAALLLELASQVLAGIEPTRRAARDLARHLDEGATQCRRMSDAALERKDRLASSMHDARFDELTAQARELRRRYR